MNNRKIFMPDENDIGEEVAEVLARNDASAIEAQCAAAASVAVSALFLKCQGLPPEGLDAPDTTQYLQNVSLAVLKHYLAATKAQIALKEAAKKHKGGRA